MLKIILISHGPFSKGLLESIEMISGPQESIQALSLERGMDPENFKQQLKEVIEKDYDPIRGVLVLCDLKGGTPYNSTAYLSQNFKLKLVTGMNVPMVITLVTSRMENSTLEEMAALAIETQTINVENVDLEFKGGQKRGKLSLNKNRWSINPWTGDDGMD